MIIIEDSTGAVARGTRIVLGVDFVLTEDDTGIPKIDVSAGAGAVDSVSGTSNRISASPTTGDVIVDIDAAYVGQTSITTLGTIAQGTWNATAVAWSKVNKTGSVLGDIANITITGIATNELLKWNGSAWINNTLAEAGISASGHNHDAIYLGITATATDSSKLENNTLAEVQDHTPAAHSHPVTALTGAVGQSIIRSTAAGTAWQVYSGGSAGQFLKLTADTPEDTWQAASIGWADVSKTGSSLADLVTRAISATTGTLAVNRGGTNKISWSVGSLVYASAATTLTDTGAGQNANRLQLELDFSVQLIGPYRGLLRWGTPTHWTDKRGPGIRT